MHRRILFRFANVVLVIAAIWAIEYVRWVGYPQVIAGRWVRPRIVAWYWTGMPGCPYPGVIQYGYRDQQGKFVAHGPYLRRIWTTTNRGFRPAKAGFI